jgi:hypothetical protein
MTTQEKIEQKEKELSELKALALKEKEEKESLKPGDYCFYNDAAKRELVTVYRSGIMKVDKMCHITNYGLNNVFLNQYNSTAQSWLRKATEEEIKNYLLSEAEKKGFVKGARVKVVKKVTDGWYSVQFGTFDPIKSSFGDQGVIEHLSIRNNSVYAKMNCHGTGEVCIDAIKLLPSTPQIEINGYKAEFKEWGISFNGGCAKISKEVFIQLAKSCNGAINDDNRTLESVKIGKGEFTRDQIKEIATHFTK